jgi:prepilin-type N-terminal cleavage/methylation domain-containing protein
LLRLTNNQNRHRGFTLIELLVVIAIIAILASILFPVFAQAKMAAKKIADLSNMKQLGTATFIYMNDYDDFFPINRLDPVTPANSFKWSSSQTLGPYIKNTEIFKNPAEAGRSVELTGSSGTYTVSPGRRIAPMSFLANALNYLDTGGGTIAFGPQTGGDAAYAGRGGPIGWAYSDATPMKPAASGTSLEDPSTLILYCDGAEDWSRSAGITPLPNTEIFVGSDDLYNGLDAMALASGTAIAGAQHAPITNTQALQHAWTLFSGGANYVFTDSSAKNLRVGRLFNGLYLDQRRFLTMPLNP